MLALLYLLLIGVLAFQLQARIPVIKGFTGAPRFLFSLGLTLFAMNWVNFLLFVAAGGGQFYLRTSWGLLLLAVFYLSGLWKSSAPGPSYPWAELFDRLSSPRRWNGPFLFVAAFVLLRFYVGLDADEEGNVWSTFNFVDTAFHLSVVNAFLGAAHFPPLDLDVTPFPLKYHFLADFHVSHLARMGLSALNAMWLMNVISAAVLVGALWAAFERWLRLPPRWVMLGMLIFLFLNIGLLNVVHYFTLHPPFLSPAGGFYNVVRFPYFNFESIQSNMLEPQRGLLFSLPVVLLILQVAFGAPEADPSQRRHGLLLAFGLVCLLPFTHIVAFAVMVPCLLPGLWRDRRWFFSRWWIWSPAFAIGVLQLLYLARYGPPPNAKFSSWTALESLPLGDFAGLPAPVRPFVFWLLANGDFLFWGGLFTALAVVLRSRADQVPGGAPALGNFLRQWRWYLVVCLGFFALINVYRYSPDWGDSNKFVFFLNLGLALVITLGAAQWINRRGRLVSQALWIFFFVLCIGPATYGFYNNVLASGHGPGTVLLFEKNGRRTAEWVRTALRPDDVILTAANNMFHFVTPLAGRPTLAGIYSDSNPYRQDERTEQIRLIYERCDLQLLQKLPVAYVCVSRNERRKYTLHPKWAELMRREAGVAFHAGGGPEDSHSVFIFDARQLAGE